MAESSTLLDNNKLIAEFMEHLPILEYDKSWDALMPVVEQIDSFCVGNHGRFLKFEMNFTINEARIMEGDTIFFSHRSGHNTKHAVYEVIVDFALWYNKTKREVREIHNG
jgi:hypothetical protein